MSAVEHADVLSEAIQKYLREKVAKKIRKRKENGWEEVHMEMKTVAQNIEESCELSEAIQKLPPELREKILKEFVAIKIKGKKKWDGAMFMKSLKICHIAKNKDKLQKYFHVQNATLVS